MEPTGEQSGRRIWVVANWGTAVGLVVACVCLGYLLRWATAPARAEPAAASPTTAPGAATTPAVWTCSMHPTVRQPGPGQCPICRMDLIRLEGNSAGASDPRLLALSENAKALIAVETVAVERRYVTAEVRMVGKIDFDETRLAYITAWVPGRLDRLFVDYTGMPIRRGDHMVEIYSPELLTAQEEFLQARKAMLALKGDDPKLVRGSVEATFEAAREKLRLLGLTPQQTAELALRGKATDRLTIYAPTGGIVVHKHARQGMYVRTGTRLFTIADLARVWVRLDAYESDLAWLRYGQQVAFTTDSLPGRTFGGMISFIDPVLTEATRTVRVRVTAANADGALKPGMFVRAVVRSRIAAGGRLVAPELAGKWISPMHPEVIKDAPGKCDVCGMPLVRAEALGYVPADPNDTPAPLVVPVSAVLRTGKRAIVYVEKPGGERPTYEMREIRLGARAGEHYLVASGLEDGERVVARGNFRIDSERQIRGLPSMMAPEGLGAGGHAHGADGMARPPEPAPRAVPALDPAFRGQVAKVFAAYFATSEALAGDDAAKAVEAARAMRAALAAVKADALDPRPRRNWDAHAAMVRKILDGAVGTKGIEPIRADFALLSEQMMVLAESFGGLDRTVYQIRCPMAFNNRGATWLQLDEKVRNPYFGAAMLTCGAVLRELPAASRPAVSRPAGPPAHEHRHEPND